MVLTGIEERLRTPKAESAEAPRDLHIEHIMPQAWHEEHWPLPAGVERVEAAANRNRAVHTIGNLTLVNGRLNPSLSNGPWIKRREALAEPSVMFLNKRLVNDGPETGMSMRSRTAPSGSTSGPSRCGRTRTASTPDHDQVDDSTALAPEA